MVCVSFVESRRRCVTFDRACETCSENCQDWAAHASPVAVPPALARVMTRGAALRRCGLRIAAWLTGGPAPSEMGVNSVSPRRSDISSTSPGDPGAATRSLPVAHQCLTKRCSPEVLIRIIERAA